ncbi:hypothetical protein V5P93_000141 [Actinokineospora auranticolor]|nr:hypothetical protein [Actinokineospora auranticolor]
MSIETELDALRTTQTQLRRLAQAVGAAEAHLNETIYGVLAVLGKAE